MRFYEPYLGDVRYRTFFAFLPVRIGKETRWLEKVKVREVYSYDYYNKFYYWDRTRFDPVDSK